MTARRWTRAGVAALLALAAATAVTPASAAPAPQLVSHAADTRSLPAPPAPPTSVPRLVSGLGKLLTNPLPLLSSLLGPASNAAPGANPNQRTLVLYDSTGPYAWLGEAYAVEAANLISHGSAYKMQPVAQYTANEMAGYTGVVYLGSTYDEPIPTAFLDDVLSGSRPVIWMNDNLWQLTQRSANFTAQYGFTWTGFDFSNTPTVTYKNTTLQRDVLAAPSGLLATTITDPAKASSLAVANRADGSSLNWAVRGSNLTYIGEIPFSYVGFNDRYYAAADLLTLLANPATPNRKRALVRIEDVSPGSDPTELRQVADYLHSAGVPFSVAVIPQYKDPNGYYNNGTAQNISLAGAPAVVSALRYMQSHGGTLEMHGYTHQYSNVANPYSGVSGDDFEFYRAHIDSANNVVYDGPPAEDSALWAQSRMTMGKLNFTLAGLPTPTVFEPPHYAASAVDYQVVASNFAARYDRGLYFGGWCPNGSCGSGTPDYSKLYGQYFPFLVRDIYGSPVIPEQLGNVEPVPYNNHPARLPADILATAQSTSVVTDTVQSFFYHPYLGTSYLRQIVTGLQGMGYGFVTASAVAAG
ncbi:DUF2334 domain-containing protein [Kutzneria albida]|uniref:DUF2334 domain-containing protein n=1 Tax=Kutzneria albida DSM 43870 TaxID=1449976 RepID=W5WDT8_9PSEU|nr:polysaccharide deacetylase family protein [Kutzneria albida]AHH99348.1 hypothetical protein KALB_5988 [Kutzneria albida DSM 43870]